MCTNRYSAKYLRWPSADLQGSLGSSLLSGTLSCELWLPWSPWTLSNISSTQGVYQVLPGFFFPVLLSRNHLTVVSWGNCRAHLICFLSSGFPVLDCPMFSVLKIVVSYIFVFPFLIVSGGRANLVPITPSWPEVEV